MNQRVGEEKSNQYYLVRFFYRLPYPFLAWPILILITNLFLYYFQKVIVGNIFLSIISLLFIILIYEKNDLFMVNFKENNCLEQNTDLRNKINKLNRIFFGKIQFIAVLLAIAMRGLVQIYLFPDIFIDEYLLNDTITMFLILSLIFTFIGITLNLYTVTSIGVYAKYPFEIYCAYIDSYYQIIINTIFMGAILTVFGLGVLLWGSAVDQLELGSLITIPILLLIILNFFIGILGIRNGISKSKKLLLLDLLKEINIIKNQYNNLASKSTIESLSIQSQLNTLLSSLMSRGKEIEQIKEWFFDFWSFLSIFIAPILYTIIRIIMERYLI